MFRPRILFVAMSLLIATAVAFGQAKTPPRPAIKPPNPAAPKPAPAKPESGKPQATKPEPVKAKPEPKPAPALEPEVDARVENGPHAAEETAIRKLAEEFIAAYHRADAAAAAEFFTPDAEYIDESGDILQGRQAIQESLTADFAENPGGQLELEIESIRFISPGVAIEDGYSTTLDAEHSVLAYQRYSAIHVKGGDGWLTASLREHAPKDRREHRAHLAQLAWLMGEWVDESPDSVVLFSCVPSEDGNFLVRTFTQHIAGEPLFQGTQWIGWDPLNQQLRSWIFDSEGGFSTGVWHHDHENWLLKSNGVTADGEPASSTTIFALDKDHHLKWQMVDQEIGGVAIPDSEIITIAARAPSPEMTEHISGKKTQEAESSAGK